MRQYHNELMKNDLEKDSLNYTELANKYNISRPTVRAYAKRLGLHKGNTKRLKKHSLNINYFDAVDTPNKAYILGFIYADGCNTRNGLQIGIQEEDKEVLEFIKSELNISNALRYIKPANINWKPKWELSIRSIEFSKVLTDVGCPPAKSLILSFPDFIHDDLMPHFIRGYFDGDGCITICKKGYGRLYFTCGSEDFTVGLRNYFYKTTGYLIPMYKYSCYSLMTSKQDVVKSIINLMYTNSTFSMQRKFKKASVLLVEKGG
jgi:hypothetical protein